MKHILFLTVFVTLSIATTLPTQAVAQRFGDGRVLRKIFGLETEPEIPPSVKLEVKTPQAMPRVNVTQPVPTRSSARPTPATIRTPGRPTPATTRTRPTPAQTQQRRQYTVPPTTASGLQRTSQRPALQPVPLPRSPQQKQYGTQPRRTTTPTQNYARRSKEPTPAPHSLNMESPLETKNPVQRRAPQEKTLKVVEHEQFGINVKAVGKNVVVTRVKKSGTADTAGVKTGDIVKSIGEMPINKPADIQELDEVLEPGDTVEFELVRKGKPKKMLVAFERETAPEGPVALKLDDEDFDPQPTLAVRPAEPADTSVLDLKPTVGLDSDADVKKLRELVDTQQQLIDRLQQRLNQIEQANVPTPAAKTNDQPLLLLN